MTQEEKQLLIKDLCARLPYGVKCKLWSGNDEFNSVIEPLKISGLDAFMCNNSFKVKPYLRPMSSMTDEEEKEFSKVFDLELEALKENSGHSIKNAASSTYEIDFYNIHHFDYRGLIEKGLAIEVTEGNNPYK